MLPCQPIAGVDVAVGKLLAYAGGQESSQVSADDNAAGQVRLLIRPVERGVATRLSADAAALKALASGAITGADDAGGPGLPIPNGFPIPAPAR